MRPSTQTMFDALLRLAEVRGENRKLREAIRKVLAMNRPIAADAREVLQNALRGDK